MIEKLGIRGGKIIEVIPGSPADSVGIRPGDELMSLNNAPLRDVLDYQIACLDEHLKFEIKRGGRCVTFDLHREDLRPLGIKFAGSIFNRLKTCVNSCIFCFIDQLPPKLRSSLYLKDDDYRLSFLYGNFITLTNLVDRHIDRIIEQRLSPLYVSLHSIDPRIRRLLIRPKREDKALDFLSKLIVGGIDVHVQVVLCPGINDGNDLDKTVSSLADLGVKSIGIVPVGLTGYRDGLPPIRPATGDIASKIIEQIIPYQQQYLKTYGRRLVFLADEFYLLAGFELPLAAAYEDYPQIENGIGIARLFLQEVEEGLLELEKPGNRRNDLVMVTSGMAAPIIKRAAKMIGAAWNADIQILRVRNRFFAGGVSVTGLLTGRDIIDAIQESGLCGRTFLIPDVCLNGDRLLLDDITESEVRQCAPGCVEFVPSTGRRFMARLLQVID